MKGINKVILIGTLGQDPEVRYMPNGSAVANISMATSEKWKDKNTGQMQEKTEWHRVVIFGKLAEIAGEYLQKGSSVYIEGKLQTRKWQDQATGTDKYTTEVLVDFGGQMQMLGGKTQNESHSKPQQAQPGGFQQPQQQQAMQSGGAPQAMSQGTQGYGTGGPQAPQQPPQGGMGFDSDIPF